MTHSKPTQYDVIRLAAAASCDLRTARKWLDGGSGMKPSVASRLAAAAKTVGLDQRAVAP